MGNPHPREFRIFVRTGHGKVEPRHIVAAKGHDDAVRKGQNYSLIMGVRFSHVERINL